MHPHRVLSIAGLVLAASATTLLAAGPNVAVKEEKPGLLARARVAPNVAEATAQARFPNATTVSAEIEEEDRKLIYSFDFKTTGKSGIDEVNMDSSTGAVLRVEHESQRAEAKEKAADTKKTGPKSR